MEEEAVEFEDDEFHGFIRTQVVCLILFLTLYGISFLLIQYFKSHSDSDELYAGDEDFFVYRVSWGLDVFLLIDSFARCTRSSTVLSFGFRSFAFISGQLLLEMVKLVVD
ncbi:LMBR1-like region [Aphelenchoides besseyi]|nr:LMBR1-like region [Aphelenchoides besseyi]